GLGAFSASTTAYGFGIEPVLRLRVARYDLLPPQWPADFDLRIAVIADLHACDPWMSLERIEAIVDRTNALKADIIVMLGDYDATRLAKAGRPFWLAGLGDQLGYLPARRFRPVKRIGVDDLAATLGKVSDDAPVVLLAHEPDIAVRVPARVALQLSGHTHGGQVRLFGWSPVVPSRYGNRLAYGHTRTNCDVVVSGGLGCSIMPFRLGVPPEIVLVTL